MQNTNTRDIPIPSVTQRYLRDMGQHALLDKTEETELARRYRQTGDREALDRLVKSNLRLVVKIARDFSGGDNRSLADLIQEGNEGLVQAAKKFDPSKNVKFSYYASFWIKARIYKYLMDNHRVVRIGTTQPQRKLFFNLQKTRSKLESEGIEPSAEAIAERLRVSSKDVVEMQKRLDSPDVALNAPVPGREGGERVDLIPAAGRTAEETYGDHQLKTLLNSIIRQFRHCLDKREKAILEHRVLASNPDTLQALGERFGVSRERIRQVEGRIVQKLRDFWLSRHTDMNQFLRT